MKNYIAHIKSKPPHERRQHAMQLSGAIVLAVFIVWISTLSVRFAMAPQASTGDVSQLANIVSGTGQQNASLIVATSSDSQGY